MQNACVYDMFYLVLIYELRVQNVTTLLSRKEIYLTTDLLLKRLFELSVDAQLIKPVKVI